LDEDEVAFVDTVTNAEANVVDFNLDANRPPQAAVPAATDEPDMLDFDLGFGTEPAPAEDYQSTHKLHVSDTLGAVAKGAAQTAAEAPSAEEFNLDLPVAGETMVNPQVLDLDAPPLSPESTVVNPMAMMQEPPSKVDDEIVDIGVVDGDALEFDVKLTDSTILGQPMQAPSFDMGSINLDLAAESVAPPAPAEAPAPAEEAAADDSVGMGTQWEAVSTKLDLAKAYEEMGDLEGARELLQEVLSEGSPALAEQAQAILARIGN